MSQNEIKYLYLDRVYFFFFHKKDNFIKLNEKGDAYVHKKYTKENT